MRAASRLTILACLITLALAGTGWCANFVYKGKQTLQSVATGEKVPVPIYLVLAEDGIVDVSGDYVYVAAKLFIVGGVVGRKRFVRADLPEMRALHLTTLVGAKLRGVTIVTRGSATDTNIGNHSIQAEALHGVKKDLAARMPPKLQGTSMFASGSGASSVATGAASFATWKLSLVPDLTDQAQPGETLDQTAERVAAFLVSKGFVELVM